MANPKKSEVYLVRDLDLDIFKIGQRTFGNSRMKNKASHLKNGYATRLEEINCTRPILKAEATELENQLHRLLDAWRTEYPLVKLSIEVDGKEFSDFRQANGFTEWFRIPSEMLPTVIDLIESV